MPTVRSLAPVATTTLSESGTLLALLSGQRCAQLPLRGEVGAAEAEVLASRVLALAGEGRPCQTLDLRRVTHWDYRCLPVLWQLAQRLRAKGGDLRLSGANRYLRTILRFGGLEPLLTTSATRHHAHPVGAPRQKR